PPTRCTAPSTRAGLRVSPRRVRKRMRWWVRRAGCASLGWTMVPVRRSEENGRTAHFAGARNSRPRGYTDLELFIPEDIAHGLDGELESHVRRRCHPMG